MGRKVRKIGPEYNAHCHVTVADLLDWWWKEGGFDKSCASFQTFFRDSGDGEDGASSGEKPRAGLRQWGLQVLSSRSKLHSSSYPGLLTFKTGLILYLMNSPGGLDKKTCLMLGLQKHRGLVNSKPAWSTYQVPE